MTSKPPGDPGGLFYAEAGRYGATKALTDRPKMRTI